MRTTSICHSCARCARSRHQDQLRPRCSNRSIAVVWRVRLENKPNRRWSEMRAGRALRRFLSHRCTALSLSSCVPPSFGVQVGGARLEMEWVKKSDREERCLLVAWSVVAAACAWLRVLVSGFVVFLGWCRASHYSTSPAASRSSSAVFFRPHK